MMCPRCGCENDIDSRFCRACGASLRGREESYLEHVYRYLPSALADKIRQLGGKIESERRHVTVLFADISGFTAMSETLDPEEVTRILNSCFQDLADVIFRYEGTIDKFIGDEIMALFGVPIAHENDPERALRAAMEMRERIRRFNDQIKVPLPKPLTLHMGINTGEVIAGNVGADTRMEYSVIGDTVNVAARLVATAKSDQILASEKTHALTRHLIDYAPPRSLKLHGKTRKVQVYEAVGMKAYTDQKLGVQSGYGPLVDRDAEILLLKEGLGAVRRGRGQVIGISGEAGVGKSRLVDEMQRMAGDFSIVSSSCVSYETPPAYQMFSDLLKGIFRIERDDGETVIRGKIETWVAAHGIETRDGAYLRCLLGLREESLLHLLDDEKAEGFFIAVRSVVRSLSQLRPLLLVLEDLHWIDLLSRRLLDRLVMDIRTLPILLCCVYRPEFQHQWRASGCFRAVEVQPISPSLTRELTRALIGIDLPPDLDRIVVEKTEGNPFFIEEMIKALIDQGAIEKTHGGYSLGKDVPALSLPDTIYGVIMGRVDRLQAQAQETLRYAAVIGHRFSEALLDRVSPWSGNVRLHLIQLQSLELVFRQSIFPELEYIFRHFVTREVVYDSILVKRRKAMHLEVAKAIEKLYADRLSEYYEVLADHFSAGENWPKAAEYYGLASGRTRELQADEGAQILADRRDQAIRKLYEQKERKPIILYSVIGVTICGIALSIAQFIIGTQSIPRNIYNLVSSLFGFSFTLLLLVRSKLVRSATVYTDRVMIRSPRKALLVPFDALVRVRWICQMGWRDYLNRSFSYLASWFRRERFYYGTRMLRKDLRSLYFGNANEILFYWRNGPPVRLFSSESGVLYRQLKTAVQKWAASHDFRLDGVFQGSPSPAEECYHLQYRKRGEREGEPVTYDGLIEMVERGEMDEHNEILVKGLSASGETWMALSDAARKDERLHAAFHPFRYCLKAFVRHPIVWCTLVWDAIQFSFDALEKWPTVRIIPALLNLASMVAIVVDLVFVSSLRFGFLTWVKRFSFSRRTMIALRITTGFLAVGLYLSVSIALSYIMFPYLAR